MRRLSRISVYSISLFAVLAFIAVYALAACGGSASGDSDGLISEGGQAGAAGQAGSGGPSAGGGSTTLTIGGDPQPPVPGPGGPLRPRCTGKVAGVCSGPGAQPRCDAEIPGVCPGPARTPTCSDEVPGVCETEAGPTTGCPAGTGNVCGPGPTSTGPTPECNDAEVPGLCTGGPAASSPPHTPVCTAGSADTGCPTTGSGGPRPNQGASCLPPDPGCPTGPDTPTSSPDPDPAPHPAGAS